MYKKFILPFLFRYTPEAAHYKAMRWLHLLLRVPFAKYIVKKIFSIENPSLETELFGIRFPNPVGLAAGFDKDGKYFEDIAHLGFGFIEIGTVTPLGQEGNPAPRLFRLPADKALINRMGFNNEGVEALVERLRHRKTRSIIGGNIGKNKLTPIEEANKDYLLCFEKLYPFVDYFVVNVSSPNTPNLRALQDKEPLSRLLKELQAANLQKKSAKPILLKIAPDLSLHELDDILEIVQNTHIAGIVATNTTVRRDGLLTPTKELEQIGMGGLSGAPVRLGSTEIIRYLSQKSEGKLPIIAVGGIFTPEDAIEKINAGASLVQVYTGFIYEGPAIVKRINKGILEYKHTKI